MRMDDLRLGCTIATYHALHSPVDIPVRRGRDVVVRSHSALLLLCGSVLQLLGRQDLGWLHASTLG